MSAKKKSDRRSPSPLQPLPPKFQCCCCRIGRMPGRCEKKVRFCRCMYMRHMTTLKFGGRGELDGEPHRSIDGLFFRRHRTRRVPLRVKVWTLSYAKSLHSLSPSSAPPLSHSLCMFIGVVLITNGFYTRSNQFSVIIFECSGGYRFRLVHCTPAFDLHAARWLHT